MVPNPAAPSHLLSKTTQGEKTDQIGPRGGERPTSLVEFVQVFLFIRAKHFGFEPLRPLLATPQLPLRLARVCEELSPSEPSAHERGRTFGKYCGVEVCKAEKCERVVGEERERCVVDGSRNVLPATCRHKSPTCLDKKSTFQLFNKENESMQGVGPLLVCLVIASSCTSRPNSAIARRWWRAAVEFSSTDCVGAQRQGLSFALMEWRKGVG